MRAWRDLSDLGKWTDCTFPTLSTVMEGNGFHMSHLLLGDSADFYSRFPDERNQGSAGLDEAELQSGGDDALLVRWLSV